MSHTLQLQHTVASPNRGPPSHYHEERPHQSLGNKLITPMNHNAANTGRVVRRQHPGGVLSYYHREAA